MKTSRGTIDYMPEKQDRIKFICETITKSAKQFGAQEIDTPTMELTSLLLNKYGKEAESKLIYKIIPDSEKEDSEKNALRYDLTVPFVRFAMTNGLESYRRIQVGKVYRRDPPSFVKGRFCEFIQADFDILGPIGEPMVNEAEIMRLICLVMKRIGISGFEIRVNFRQNLEKIVELSCPDMKSKKRKKLFKSICCSIDKLDKEDWDYVGKELVGKGLSEESVSKLRELLDGGFIDEGVNELYSTFSKYCDCMGCDMDKIRFDTTLARGLDYYTGMIYEVSFVNTEKCSIGTIIAGGRYDKMIYRNKKGSRSYIPAIGVSFGVSRLELVMNELGSVRKPWKILIVGEKKYLKEKMQITNLLLNDPRTNGNEYQRQYVIKYFTEKKKNVNQINYGIKNDFEYIIICGEDGDVNDNELNVKVKRNDHSEDKVCQMSEVLDLLI